MTRILKVLKIMKLNNKIKNFLYTKKKPMTAQKIKLFKIKFNEKIKTDENKIEQK